MIQHKFDPEAWLESATRALRDYVANGLNNLVLDDQGDPVGYYDENSNPGGIYEIVMEFPQAGVARDKVPLPRTIIHFEIDGLDDRPLGLGRRYGAENYDALLQTVNPQEAAKHIINFDVGIWSSDSSGGTTARMRAMQLLQILFQGALAQDAIDAATDGGDGRLEIIGYSGGSFITEHLNDVATYRMVDGTLEVRVFSRTPLGLVTAPTIEEIVQEPNLTIAE